MVQKWHISATTSAYRIFCQYKPWGLVLEGLVNLNCNILRGLFIYFNSLKNNSLGFVRGFWMWSLLQLSCLFALKLNFHKYLDCSGRNVPFLCVFSGGSWLGAPKAPWVRAFYWCCCSLTCSSPVWDLYLSVRHG